MEELKFTFYNGESVVFNLSDIKNYTLLPENYKMFISVYENASSKPTRTIRLEFDIKEWYDKNLSNYSKWQLYKRNYKMAKLYKESDTKWVDYTDLANPAVIEIIAQKKYFPPKELTSLPKQHQEPHKGLVDYKPSLDISYTGKYYLKVTGRTIKLLENKKLAIEELNKFINFLTSDKEIYENN